MTKSIIDENMELLNSLGPLTGDAARLAHRLNQTNDRLWGLLSQAQAQLMAGDKYATFNRHTIDKANEGLTGK